MAACSWGGGGNLLGANVLLTASDALGTSSINSVGNWSNGAVPSSTNSYATAGFTLRSPANTASYTFTGGSLRIDSGGRFLMKGLGGQTITISNLILNGGLADFANAGTDYYTETLAGNITLQAGTLSYMGALSGSPDFETLLVTAPITGSGSLQLGGPNVNAGADNGVVIFAGTNSYTGVTTVAGGTLLINGPNGPGNLIVTNGSTLGGTGSVGGALSLLAGGKLAPGIPSRGPLTATLGTLSASNTSMIAGAVIMRIDRTSVSTNDRLAAASIVVNAGATLTVTNVGSTNLVAGDAFALFSTPISGAFTTLNLPALPNPALIWTNRLAVNGTIAIVATNLVAVSAANPPVVAASQTALLTIAVTPAANPTSTGITVTANLTPVGGVASQIFYDDGTHGDATAADGVFSFNIIVSSNTPLSSLTLNASVNDAQGRSVSPKITLTVVTSGTPFFAASFLPLSEINAAGSLPLAAGGQSAPIYYSANDATVVAIAATALRDDVQRVTGVTPLLSTNTPAASFAAVFVGTIGKSTLIDGLIAAGKVNVSSIQGQWESYLATVVTNPVAGVSRALVIAGSDRRGTAFGVFGLSEAIGVSPWYWFGDVPVMQRSALYVGAGNYTEPSPGVKYRGIFLNDEDWGLNPWAEQVFDPSGQIGPATHVRIFELLLRLRANYIWPAMHNVTKAFYTVPGNREIAENYAIVVGTSHHEPMLRNTSEYNTTTLGAYNYWTNRANIYSFWEQRVIETATNESIYTVGMRGLGDDAMIAPVGTTTQQKADELENFIIPDQRQMISDHVNANPALVPQVFVPYKEALVLYQTGMQVPEDITLCWPDDNHGYIRQLSSAAERARSGGSGVYYHLSYWGPPTSYLWLLTTPPAMTCAEMMKAWDYQARRIWIANVGDLKPGEIGMEFFLRLAWNPEAFRNFNQHAYLVKWAAQNFGTVNAEAIATLLDEYYRLNIILRPEQLNFATSGFSLVSNGDEAQQRLDQFAALTASANTIYAQLPANQKAAFYAMILYPIRGANLQNQKVLLAERSRLWAAQGRAATTNLALAAQATQNTILAETAFYNQTNANGKWNRTMTVTTTGEAKMPYIMPTLGGYAAPTAAGMGVAVEGSATALSNSVGLLPTFNPVANKSCFIDVFNTGTSAMSWTAQSSAPWIALTQTNGNTDARIWIGIDWANAPRGYAVPGTVTIRGAGVTNTVNVKAFYPLTLNLAALPPAVENNGVVTIEAENFTTRQDSTNGVGWRELNRACVSGDGMTILPVTAAAINPAAISSNTPSLTYQFHTFSAGATAVQMGCLPTHKITSDHVGCRYAISLNGDTPQIVDINADEFTAAWSANVLRATANGRSSHTITNAGLQTLKVWMIDPGVVLDKVTVTINTGVFEAENLGFTASTDYHTFSESGLSGDGAMSLDATSVGQNITFVLPHLAAGVFDLMVRAKTWNNRGIAQVSIGNTVNGPFSNLGSPLDFYTAAVAYTNVATIRVTNVTAGPKYLKVVVTGKNASSSGYQIALDNFAFVPVQLANVDASIEAWRMAYFGTSNNTGAAADAADVDQDGIPNLLEYATGSYPTITNGPLLTVSLTNNHLAVTFSRAKNVSNVTLHAEAASSLTELISGGTEIWSSASSPYEGGDSASVLVTVIDPLGATNAARFLRLRASQP
ncbi:MAG: glycosyl hydrolase 115 family protein [Verrucomicrobiota bacterium]